MLNVDGGPKDFKRIHIPKNSPESTTRRNSNDHRPTVRITTAKRRRPTTPTPVVFQTQPPALTSAEQDFRDPVPVLELSKLSATAGATTQATTAAASPLSVFTKATTESSGVRLSGVNQAELELLQSLRVPCFWVLKSHHYHHPNHPNRYP